MSGSGNEIPFAVQIELLEHIAEHESFAATARSLEVLSPDDIKGILRAIAAFLRATHETEIYDEQASNILSGAVKKTLGQLSATERRLLFESFGLEEDES